MSDSKIAAAYDRWSKTYDRDPNRTRDLAGHALRESNLVLDQRQVVEIGCGTGRNTEWLASQAANVVALDFSEEMLRRAQERIRDPRVRLLQHDLHHRWPLPEHSADLIIAMLVLEHIGDLQRVFSEATRTLRPAGELFICELHPMRQLLGGQAQFNDLQTGTRELVPAFIHSVSDFVNGGLSAGLELKRLDEWPDGDAQANSLPRLLSLQFKKK